MMKFIVIIFVLLKSLCEANIFRGVKINEQEFENVDNNAKFETHISRYIFGCAITCLHFSWCSTWCFDEPSSKCIVNNLMVSPLYQNDNANSKKCYTSLKIDLAFGASITSSKTSSMYGSSGVAERLTQGFYNYQRMKTCGGFQKDSSPIWILFDLHKQYTIKEVRVTTAEVNMDSIMPRNAEVKIGNEPSSNGDFTSYTPFGQLPSDATHLKTYPLKVENGITGRYLSLQASAENDGLTICYVQIFD